MEFENQISTALAQFLSFGNLHIMRYLVLLGLASIGVALTMTGDVLLKRSNTGAFWQFGAGLLFYSLGCIPVIFIFRMADFGSVFILWEALTVILAVIVGRILFGESITVGKIAAVGLVIGGLIVLNR